ncbi:MULTISPECIES: Flp pilus assembly protein CpaB [Comamonas]|uniref:Flp pilus assembly protein CpaB n=1 Tax=Comamonas TaxID=283 RepID=UPI0001DA6C5C|nr:MULTISPECIES: Flp pilus assembly protein CpaB [Comamonas]EFI60012.1 putative signal peptide protein, CpaB like protein [Comamonas thiooxydans]TFF61215.1 Flp pilus assembly protein CpaB [Comamonas sp. A23]
MVNVAKIAVGVLLAVALALGVYGWMLARAPQAADPQASASASDSKSNAGMSVVVAAQAIPAGQALKTEDLQLTQLPAKPDGAYGEIQAAVGSVPAVDVPKGAPVLQGQMVTGLALKLSEGERAVAVKVDESIGAGNRIRPGDFVDVFFALRRDGNEIDQSQARLLLSRKRVLAYGAASVDALSSAEKTEGKQANGPDNARTAVLAVPVAEVNQLLLGGSNGSLLLALRNPMDMTEPDSEKFAPLPGILAVAMAKGSVAVPLEGADAAQAGVAMSSLAGSAGTSAARMNAAKPMTAGVAKPAVPRTRTASTDSSLPVEFVRGANSQTVRY